MTQPKSSTKGPRIGRAGMSQQILDAARETLAQDGFAAFGVNAVARAAGCDKQLIYRYFGGLDGLVAAIGETLADRVTAGLTQPDPPPASYAALIEALLRRLFDLLVQDALVRRIAAWELADPSPLTLPLAAARSAGLQQWVAAMRGNLAAPAGIDAPAVNALLIGGVQQLALAAAAGQPFAGLALDPAGTARTQAAIAALVHGVYGSGKN